MDELKAVKKHFSKLGWMFLLGTLIIFAVQSICIWGASRFMPEWIQDPNGSLLLQMFPMYIVGMPLLICLIKRVPESPVEQHEMKAGQFAVAAVMCFGITYFFNILGNVITAIIGIVKGSEVQNVLADATGSANLFVISLCTVVCAPILEEYIFRKLLIDRVIRYGQGIAVMLSGLMFGLFHGNLNQFAYAFFLGVFFAFLYVRTGKLKIVIGLHMLINFVGTVVSSAVLRLIDLNALQEASASGDMAALMEFAAENAVGIVAYMLLVVFIYGMMIAGCVLLIVFLVKKRFRLEYKEGDLQKGKRFRTVVLNPGMLVYSIFWIGIMVFQLFI